MVLAGKGSYIYWGLHSTWKAGNPVSDKHIGFNPMLKHTPAKVKKVQEQVYTFDNLDHTIEFTVKIEEGTCTIRTYFRDPFLLLTIFTYKTLPTTWSPSASATNTITGNFSKMTNIDKNIWLQMHLHDQESTNHLDLFFDGGEITNYKLIIEAGKLVMEEAVIKFVEVNETENKVDIDNGFDDGSFDSATLDGGWSLWDGAYTKETGVKAKNCTITCSGLITGIDIQRCELEIDMEKVREYILSSLTPGIRWVGKRSPFKAKLDGKLNSNADFSEFMALYSAKTKATFKIQYGTTKYIQFTRGYLDDIDPPGEIPEAGKASPVTYTIQSGDHSMLSFSWTGTETTDPGAMITHTNI